MSLFRKFFLWLILSTPAISGLSQSFPNPQKVLLLNGYTEGIVFDSQGNFYISMPQHDTIWKVPAAGKPEVWFTAKNPNGHRILADGSHLLAVSSAVLKIFADGVQVDTISTGAVGMAFRQPNDLANDSYGGFYLTDPGSSNALDDKLGRVFYIDSTGKTTLVAMNLKYPNGIAIRPDGKTLLVAESGTFSILEYSISAPGKIKFNRVFCTPDGTPGDQFVDGMCLDENGNLYVAIFQGGMVQQIDLEGNVIAYIKSDLLTTSNVAFGGKDMDELFITGGIRGTEGKGGVMKVKLQGVKGLNPLQPSK